MYWVHEVPLWVNAWLLANTGSGHCHCTLPSRHPWFATFHPSGFLKQSTHLLQHYWNWQELRGQFLLVISSLLASQRPTSFFVIAVYNVCVCVCVCVCKITFIPRAAKLTTQRGVLYRNHNINYVLTWGNVLQTSEKCSDLYMYMNYT